MNLPDYPGSGRGLFITTLYDVAALLTWAILGALLLMTIGSPIIFILLFVYGG
jgi:hypothetical protein